MTLRDGRRVHVRPIVGADAPEIVAAAAAADPETLRLRFFTSAPNLGPGRARYLSEVDYVRRLALVAIDEDGRGVAVARYESRAEPDQAEVAFVVAPDYRRQGLAAMMLAMIVAAAAQRGFQRLAAVHLPENLAAANLLRIAGFGDAIDDDGVVTVTKVLADRPAPAAG